MILNTFPLFVLSVSVEWWLTTKVSRTMCNSDFLEVVLVLWHTLESSFDFEVNAFIFYTRQRFSHFFKELKLKVSECVFLSLKIKDLCAAAGSKGRLCWWHSRTTQEYLPVLGQYESHNYYYRQLFFQRFHGGLFFPISQTGSGLSWS